MTYGTLRPTHTDREGQPFDVSLDDLEYEVPDVDPAALMRQLGEMIF